MQEYNMQEYNMDNYLVDVYTFNELSGQHNKVDKKAFEQQLKLIFEEATEIEVALEGNDTTEVLDGVADLLYVTIGMLQKLQTLGCNTMKALEQVATENDTKFPYNRTLAEDTVEFYKAQGVETIIEYNETLDRYAIKDINNKVRKPINFIRTNLAKHVPDRIKEIK